MRNNKGFTIIEMLFSLSILCMISILTLGSTMNNKPQVSLVSQFSAIQSILEEARSLALTYHQKVYIEITRDTIGYQSDISAREITVNEGIYFDEIKDIYFNHNGTINQGNHINLCDDETCKSIIFNVGSGDFYLKQ